MKPSISGAAGLGFAALFRGVKALRPDRPIHPAGVALTGTVERSPTSTGSGIRWIDSPGTGAVTGRLSRSLGTPPGCPDILGLALRITTATGHFDLLLASTGMSRAGRWLLLPRRHAGTSAFSSLMPFKGTNGPVLLAAHADGTGMRLPASPEVFQKALGAGTWILGLYHGTPTGPWTRFGTLSLATDPEITDTKTRFDPTTHPLPGAGTYNWATNLRAPAYTTARIPPTHPHDGH
ncbi:hypothetical protein IV500_17075 [Paeniglutamicibacter antarcticus]|uniref:Phosphodiesterase n=1 Tax=Arthrobacter terrae TaxID=2935737 RepID=A0A931G6I8_9MICC|nr:hypothetical protein [Arthrobacter terrae]MBG0741088.1 hypothetical protein [Arthrobacter terrae]